MINLSTSAASLSLACMAMSPMLVEASTPDAKSFVAQLCGGGEIEIPLGKPGDEPEPHCPDGKACHAGACRKQFDPGQRPKPA